MKAEEFMERVKLILGSEIKFDGHVNKIVSSMEENHQEHLLSWINDCKLGKAIPEPCKNYRTIS